MTRVFAKPGQSVSAAMRHLACLSLLTALASPAVPASAQTTDDVLISQEKRKAAHKLALSDLDGKKRQLSDLKGKVVVVNFWATWCGPCVKEMPSFTKVYSEYRGRGVEIIGAANEERSARANVTAFIERLGIQFPIWLEASSDHMKAFGVGPELPATVIVDPQGRLAASIKGVVEEAQLRALLDRVMSEAAAASPTFPAGIAAK